jgi:hypothetical protein
MQGPHDPMQSPINLATNTTPGSEKDSHRAAAPRLSGTAGAGGEHRAAGRGRVLSPCFFHPNQVPSSLPPE